MEIGVQQKQISQDERRQISRQLKADLVDHLYEGCLPGTVSGVASSIAFFLMFYGYTPTHLLTIWVVVFNAMLCILTGLYIFYVKNKPKYTPATWQLAYTVVLTGCALMWVPCVFLMPDEVTRQFLAFLAIFMVATAYATGTIGQFYLCVITLALIVLPLTIWCFKQGGFFHNLVGFFSIIYMGFMCGVNQRSTKWFKESIKLKLENTLVSYQANHDVLTNLPNQRLLPQYLEAAINVVKDTKNTFALVCFSINRMEMIDDSLGHHVSNSIIQAVAQRLQNLAAINKNNPAETQYTVTISRKDAFYIVMAPLMPEEAAEKISALFSVLDEPFYLEQKGVKLTASIGVSLYGKHGEDAEMLLTNASAAMLRAKQFGGNRVEFYRSEINAQTPKQLELETDLYKALQENQLVLYYQPLIDLKTNQIQGSEALIRWRHPVHGFISPMHFIPLAEETGLIHAIGLWVLEEACIQTMKWHQMGFKQLKVAVNLSPKQLHVENFIGKLRDIIKKTEMDTKFLELEITETAILDESVIHTIQEFKQMGLSLAVDDFGTGYSGLSYLKRFAIDKLKIDQSFIRDIPDNSESVTIVSAIIAMAKELKVKILAEGVETEEQLEFLRAKGCDYVQGYYFSKPVDAGFFTQLLLKYQSLSRHSITE